MKTFFYSILFCAFAFGASAKEMTVKGFDGRDVVLNSDGSWKYAKPFIDLEQVLGNEFSARVFEASISGYQVSPQVFRLRGGSKGVLQPATPSEIIIVCYIGRSRPPTEYDPPYDVSAQIIDAQSGQKIAESHNRNVNNDPGLFVLPADVVEKVQTKLGQIYVFHFENSEALQGLETINLKLSCKKSYTPPPNEFSAIFKDIPVSGK